MNPKKKEGTIGIVVKYTRIPTIDKTSAYKFEAVLYFINKKHMEKTITQVIFLFMFLTVKQLKPKRGIKATLALSVNNLLIFIWGRPIKR